MSHRNPRAAIGTQAKGAGRAALLAITAVVLLAACVNPLRATLVTATSDYQAANTAVLAGGAPIQNGYGIDQAASIVFQFSQSMGPSMVSVSGDFASESKPAWSTRKAAQDTLTLAPSSGTWKPGSQKSLALKFTSGSTTATGLSYTLGILTGVLYVSVATGSDANPGTQDRPKKTIPAAVANAALFYGPSKPAEVHVAAGTYDVNYTLGTQVVMKPGISVLGSYTSDWSAPTLNASFTPASTIVDTSVGATQGTTLAVDCGKSVGADTVLDGFTVRGGGDANTTQSCAIYCSSSGPDISHVVVSGGLAQATIGILVVSGTPIIADSTIDGGSGADSTGLYLGDSGNACVVEGNIITGGGGVYTCTGIENFGSQTGSSSPVISGNTVTACAGTALAAIGIKNADSDALIEGNTIRAGLFVSLNQQVSGVEGGGFGITVSNASDVTIRNNVIVGGEIPTLGNINATAAGILLDAGATIQNNTICGGLTTETLTTMSSTGGPGCISTGIDIEPGADGYSDTIVNNIIFTLGANNQYCVLEGGVSDNPGSFANNLLFNCSPTPDYTTYFTDYAIGLNAYADPTSFDSANSSWAQYNITTSAPSSVFTTLTGPEGTSVGANWSLATGSPAIDKGQNLYSQFTTDISGNPRPQSPAPWSIGAYQ
jgi:hypothetical protein